MNQAITEHKTVKKDWGKEIWVVNNELYCGKFLCINEGWQSSLHYHKIKTETFYILQGQIKLEYASKDILPVPILEQMERAKRIYKGDETFFDDFPYDITMKKGTSIDIKPHDLHRFTALERSVIIEFSTFHSDKDVIRLEKSRFLKKGVENFRKIRNRT